LYRYTPAAKQDAVNAVALPEIELRRRSRGASEALLSRLAGLSAAPGAMAAPPSSSSASATGGGGAAAAQASSVSVSSPGAAGVFGGTSGGPAARLAETCAALHAWLTPLVRRLAALRKSLSAAVGKPLVDQGPGRSGTPRPDTPGTPSGSGRLTPSGGSGRLTPSGGSGRLTPGGGGGGGGALALAAHHQRLMLTALLRPVVGRYKLGFGV
jgi:hypothetical protein